MKTCTRTDLFEEIYKKYNGLLYGYAYTMLHSHALAEEAVQETFVRALSSLDPDRGDRSVKTWLFVTVRNHCIDVLRKESRNVGEDPLLFIPDQEDRKMEQQSFLNELINTLSPEQQQLLMLSTAGFRQREIAKRLDLPLGTVSWRMGELKKKLRAFSKTEGRF